MNKTTLKNNVDTIQFKNNFATNLQSLRKAANLTQGELAVKMNVSNKTISHWEKGYSEPSLLQLKELKQIFNTDYNDLLE